MIRIVLVLLEILLGFLIQSSAMPGISLAGVVPDLLMILVITIAYTRGRNAGMLTGLLSGLLTDLCFNEFVGYCGLLYLTVGFLAGYAHRIYEKRDFLMPLLLISAGEFLYSFGYYIAFFLLRSKTDFGFYFANRILPRMIYTILAALIIYPLLNLLHQLLLRFEHKEE